MAAKISKLDEQFKLDAPREKQKDGTGSSIFSGVAIYVNGYTGNYMYTFLYSASLLQFTLCVLRCMKNRKVNVNVCQRKKKQTLYAFPP